MLDWVAHVAAAQQGDLAAFERVVERFGSMAVGYGYSILGDFAWAEDAAQEAFIRAYLDMHMLQEPRAFPAWLRRIVFKQCDRQLRKGRPPQVPLTEELACPGTEGNPADLVQRREAETAVLRAVQELPEHERTATTLFYIDGYSLAEVGDFMEVPLSTVKSRLHSARARLRERMVDMVEDTLKQHAPGPGLGKRVTHVLRGVERIHWSTTSVLCFVGSTVACLRYLGETVDNDYAMGVSGGAFKMFWIPPWSPANCDLLVIGEEPIRQTFRALGYDYTWLPDPDHSRRRYTREELRDRIVAGIDRGVPVLADGIVGPPEICVVTGYDRGGDVLYGTSYFQQEQKGYFRTDEWYDNCYGLLLVGAKRQAPQKAEVLCAALEWAIRLARTPEFGADGLIDPAPGRVISGLAAYDAMIAGLLRDEDFPAGDLEKLTFLAMPIANDGAWLMTSKRASAAAFLRQMLDAASPAAADELRRAAELYTREVDAWQRAASLVAWSGAPVDERLKLADHGRRAEVARQVGEAKKLEEQAVQCLERALAAL